jgi:phenylalanyl-tRNA synthetase alpha chain
VLRGLGALAPEERARVGEAANATKERIEALAHARREALEAGDRARSLVERRLDVTLPGAAPARGRLHPVTLVEREMCAFFRGLGYGIAEGPEVDTDWNNFGALNFPDDHPARDTQDTLFVEGGHLLRTHTSGGGARDEGRRRRSPGGAASTATTSTPPTTRCSTRSRGCASTSARPSAI